MTITPEPPLTFKDAFAVLQANAQKLEDQTEPDIDHLMEIIGQSNSASQYW